MTQFRTNVDLETEQRESLVTLSKIRCNPSDANILDKIFTQILLSSTSKIFSMPTGMFQLSDLNMYKEMLEEPTKSW